MSDKTPPANKPSVSVILPTFNRVGVLEQAIRSVLEQTYPHFELIVIDDGSTDETPQLIQTIVDRRLRSLRLAQRRGAAAARNLGIQESAAELIAFQDSDDRWCNNKLALQVERLQAAPTSSGMVYSGFRWQRGARRGITPSGFQRILNRTGLPRHRLEGDLNRALLRGNFITTSTALFKRACLDKAGVFDESLARFQDWDLWLRIARHFDFCYIDRPLVTTYASADSISSDKDTLIPAFDRLLEKYGNQPLAQRELTAQRHFTLGHLCMANKQVTQSRRHFSLALRASPVNAAYWLAALASLGGIRFYRRFYALTKPGG